jgi:hypothetical protein
VFVSPRVLEIQLKMVVLPTLVIPIIPHFNGMVQRCFGAKLPKLEGRTLKNDHVDHFSEQPECMSDVTVAGSDRREL